MTTIIHVDESPDISLLLLLIECMYPLQGFFKLKIVHPVMDETTSRFIVPTSHNLEHISNHYNIMMQYRMYWRNHPFLSLDFKMFNGDFVFATMFKAVELYITGFLLINMCPTPFLRALVSPGVYCRLSHTTSAEYGLCSGFSSLWGQSPLEGQRG
jgi:hypothetical protein